jgi:hypothetical protein
MEEGERNMRNLSSLEPDILSAHSWRLLPKNMPAALKRADAAKLTKPKEIHDVLEDLRKELNWPSRSDKGSFDQKIDMLVKIVRRRFKKG